MTKAHDRVHIFVHQFMSAHDNVAQFRTKSFAIAVSDPKVLENTLACRVDNNPGYKKDQSVIVTRPNGHKEVWTNPRYGNYRDTHLDFFDAVGIYLPSGYDRDFVSDHAYARSAADFQVALVKLNFIPPGGNSSYGSGLEKRFTYRRLYNEGFCLGNLFDLHKSVGGRLDNPRDPVGSLGAAIDDLENRGLISASERNFFAQEAEETMAYVQDQGEAYAVVTGHLDPDKPMIG